jgi:hypothetical protein
MKICPKIFRKSVLVLNKYGKNTCRKNIQKLIILNNLKNINLSSLKGFFTYMGKSFIYLQTKFIFSGRLSISLGEFFVGNFLIILGKFFIFMGTFLIYAYIYSTPLLFVTKIINYSI